MSTGETIGLYWNAFVGWLLGVDNVQSIEGARFSFAASWAEGGPAWVLLACAVAAAIALVFYFKYQTPGRRRRILGVVRAAVLCLICVLLAEPVLVVPLTTTPRPQLWVLFDGSQSMAIQDELPEADRAQLAAAVSLKRAANSAPANGAHADRMEYVRSWARQEEGPLAKLSEKFRVRGFVFDRPDGARSIDLRSDSFDAARAAESLRATGQVTALGRALDDLAMRHGTSALAGLVVVSDFDQNAGPPALASAKSLGVPVYAVGVGPATALDLAVDMQAPPVMKKAELSRIVVTLRQSGLDRQNVEVRLMARRRADSSEASPSSEPRLVASRSVELMAPSTSVEIPHTPDETGRFDFVAEVAALPGEVVDQNNRAEREVNIRDDFLRLMYVEHEPTWEWRFVKEVFHRDKLVGMRGFRTFLRSADPKVRIGNELFLPTLAPQRSEFFANDVIFLGDVQAATLGERFPKLVKEFVGTFGGGLVVISGSRFGPGQLASTELADMLPVVVDPDGRVQEQREFRLQLTAAAKDEDFMRLGESDEENAKAWSNLGLIPWYQPVARLHPLATSLAEHPSDTCSDGKTRQPLVAIRRYGKGEVVYLGFNQTWRLRRLYGEKHYRQFWGQMIHRLGLSHALGSQKRFVVRTDRPRYQVDDKVVISAEAFDANFEPLSADKLPERRINAELIPPRRAGDDAAPRPITLAQLREGVFEARLPVGEGGSYRVCVKDPITAEYSEVHFEVASVSAERRSAVRNVALQQALADSTGGKAYDLISAARLADDVKFDPKPESLIKVISLWNTWLAFSLVVGLLLVEWLVRKLVSLP